MGARGKRHADRKLYEYAGEMLPMEELERRTGLTRSGINCRLQEGIPLDQSRLDSRRRSYAFRGKRCTVPEVARALDISPRDVRRRIREGRSLEEPRHSWERAAPSPQAAPTFQRGIFDDTKSFDEDKCAQLARRYLANGEPMTSDVEIRAEFADLGRLSDEGVAWVREWLRDEMFYARRGGTVGDSLELIGEFYGLSREKIRQDQERGLARAARALRAMGADSALLDELRERDASGRETHAERMEAMAPGFDGAEAPRRGRRVA